MIRLSDALDKLPQEARDVIIFRDLEEQSFAEIGELTGRTEDAARMYYARAKAKLAGIFQDK
jgi:RNA polymerase sigma-70 factor (ECF subfamily)